MIDYSLILTTHYSNKQWILKGNSYNELDWFDDSVKPTQAELDGLWEATETTKNNNAYKNQREREYPSIQEQLDMQYWDAINSTTTWQDAIQAVKNKYPKP
jgi:hypothetical protein